MGGSYSGGTYLLVLLIGAALVIADGQLIMRHGPSYLVEAYRDPRRARQVAAMVGLLFHLVMLGVVLLVTAGMDPNATVPAVLRRLGTLLILTAIGHAITMVILARLREQQTGTDLAHAQMEAALPDTADAPPSEPDASAAPAQPAAPPPPDSRRGRGRARLGRAVRPR